MESVIRRGCKDIWNAWMLEGASFCKYDIPFCPTTAQNIPASIVTWRDAEAAYEKFKRKKFISNDFVCFYLDDYKFDGKGGIWQNPRHALAVLKRFGGVITPDYSTYQDFPEALKIYATYRMRTIGWWLGSNGIAVINNVRWGTTETYSYSFEGIQKNSFVAIGTVGGSPRRACDKTRFEKGLNQMIKTLSPKAIIVYGSANYPCFDAVKASGIEVYSYKGETAAFYERRNA